MRDKFERQSTESDLGWGAVFIAGMLTGCLGWAWMVDSAELSASVKWLGQGVAMSACIFVALGVQMVCRRSSCDWKRMLLGPVTGVVLVLAVWGTAAIAAYWRGSDFSTGAWCAALGCFGFLGHKLKQPGTRVGFMAWVYGLFFMIGIITMYMSVVGLPEDDRHSSNRPAAIPTAGHAAVGWSKLNIKYEEY